MPFRYASAPINEALIDIRVETPPGFDMRQLENLHSLIRGEYPAKHAQFSYEHRIQGGATLETSSKQTANGFRYLSADGKQIFQARRDGCTFSRLRPYWDWPMLQYEAQRLWNFYAASVRPVSIVRLAVRYINQIDIPEGPIDLDTYFRTAPRISNALPQLMEGFMMQMFFARPDFGGKLALTLAGVPPESSSKTSIILDIDVFKEWPDGLKEVPWDFFEILRRCKNEVFEGCITDKTRLLFGERTSY